MSAPSIVRKNQRTGSDIEVCTAESQGCDPDGGKWVTICWTHGTICNHETKATAIGWATHPDEWCEDVGTGKYGGGADGAATLNSCRGVWEAKEKAAAMADAEYLRKRHHELCSGLDFTDYGDHLVNPRSGTCPLCGGTAGGCRC